MRMRCWLWAAIILGVAGCSSDPDDNESGPDAQAGGSAGNGPDAAVIDDAAPQCEASEKALLLYTSPGCEAQPQWVCISPEAGSRHTRYCLCEDGGINDDLGWAEGAVKPWTGKGHWVYPEPGCDDSLTRVCSDTDYEYATYCGCDGKSYESSAPTSPWVHDGACDAGTSD